MQTNLKRLHILEVATALFGQYGYHAVGVDWIYKEAKISKKTLYKYFTSKENLIIEVLSKRDEDCFISLNETLAGVEEPLKKLELIFDWHHQWFNQQSFTGCLFTKAANEFPDKHEPIHKIVTQQKEKLIARIENILKELLSVEKANNLAPVIMMFLDGAMLSAQVIENKNAAKEAWEAVKQLIQ
ncbi:MAG: TetR/AcrR family transcriptional regulator [Acinetobacter sp.]